MQRIELTDPRLRVDGAVSIDEGDGYVTFRRLDDRWRHQFPIEVDFLVESPSGVRVSCMTDADTIGFEFLATTIERLGKSTPSIFDLWVDGEFAGRQSSDAGNVLVLDPDDPTKLDLRRGDVGTVSFDLPSGEHHVELWMPPATVLRAHAVIVPVGSEIDAPASSGEPTWVHHGSSISHCMEAHGGSQVWPAVAARIGEVDLVNLGLGGQCHLDQFTARTMRDLPADLLSLKCGINIVNGATMTMRTFPSALHGFIDTVREGHPDVPFLIVSPIICPAHEDTPGPTEATPGGKVRALGDREVLGSLTLRRTRRQIAQVVEARQAAGDANLHLLDGLELFGEADVDGLPDGLHPDGDGYVTIGERFAAHAFGTGGPFGPG